jgi:NTP pyrophosphatase (non-canonical NTP hydrolase)
MDERDYQAMNKDMESENIFKQAVDHFGVENQLLKLVEEMAELTQSIIKRKLNNYEPEYLENLIEEFVDVNLVLSQLSYSELFKSKKSKELFSKYYLEKTKYLESLLKTQNETKVEN